MRGRGEEIVGFFVVPLSIYNLWVLRASALQRAFSTPEKRRRIHASNASKARMNSTQVSCVDK